jgi:hypothetical protein
MQPTHSTLPMLEILDDLVPADLHAAAWKRCSGAGWYFGHASVVGDGSAFWKMDLDSDPAFHAIWEHARTRCEALAGTSLRVRRQYANGHTYGLGGHPHRDDGEFTLLYYPNPEWKDGWDGETVYYDASGEITAAVRPRPNRCVFFDAGLLHAGRAPSRACPVLRVTVAYKLQRVGPSRSLPKVSSTLTAPPDEPFVVEKLAGEGSQRVYSIRVPAAIVERAVSERLANLAGSVRVPGFRPGAIPEKIVKERYGKQARIDTLNRLAGDALSRALPEGSIASAAELKGGVESGDLDMHVVAVHLPELPAVDFSDAELDRPDAPESVVIEAGIAPEAARERFREYLKAQVLDRLDAAYPFPVLPSLVEREFKQIWKAAPHAGVQGELKAQVDSELRAIAERRLRLAYIVGEMARRLGIQARDGIELEDKVIDHFVAQTRVRDRMITEPELREFMQS